MAPILKEVKARKPYLLLSPRRKLQIANEAKKEFLQYLNAKHPLFTEKDLSVSICSSNKSVEEVESNICHATRVDVKRQRAFDSINEQFVLCDNEESAEEASLSPLQCELQNLFNTHTMAPQCSTKLLEILRRHGHKNDLPVNSSALLQTPKHATDDIAINTSSGEVDINLKQEDEVWVQEEEDEIAVDEVIWFSEEEDALAPQEETVCSSREEPANDPVIPANDSVIPANDSVIPANDSVIPANDPEISATDPAIPANDSIIGRTNQIENDILNRLARLEEAISVLSGNISSVLKYINDDHRHNKGLTYDVYKTSIDLILPVKSVDELQSLEQRLKDSEELASEFKAFIVKIGGRTENEHISNVCRRLMPNELAMKCSWFGLKNNVPLHDLLIMKLFRNVITGIHRVTDSVFQRIVSNWLRYARQRYERGGQGIKYPKII